MRVLHSDLASLSQFTLPETYRIILGFTVVSFNSIRNRFGGCGLESRNVNDLDATCGNEDCAFCHAPESV